MLSDLAELIETVPAFAALRPLFDSRAIRIEDEFYDDAYEVRAELPGVDPDDDIDVTVRDGILAITARRPGPDDNCGRSEFQYGSFTRTLVLPEGADADEASATYDRGILTVSVPLSEQHRLERRVEVVEVVAIDDDPAEADTEDLPDDGADQHEPDALS